MYRTDRGSGRPAPVFRPPDEPVVDGILDDVLECRVVLLLGLDHFRPVAPAEEMVLATVPLVECPGVDAVQVPHAQVEIGLGRLDEEVVVVPHQAADVHPPPVAPLDAPQDVQEDDPVRVVAHDRPVVVPPGHDVVAGAGAEVSVRASHPANVAAAGAVVSPRARIGTRPTRTRHVPGTRPGWMGRGRRDLSVWD
jgi:hypothetical protein